MLASGVVAAEKMDNLALGLRLLTVATKAEGCAPDSGDVLVAIVCVRVQERIRERRHNSRRKMRSSRKQSNVFSLHFFYMILFKHPQQPPTYP